MATDTAENLGAEPLRPLLAKVDEIDSVPALAQFWGWSLRHGIGALFDIDNDADPGDPARYLVFVGQSGIGLPDEEYYRLRFQHAATRDAYRAHMARMLELAGVPEPAQQAARAFELETQIAAAHWDKVRTRDMVQMYFPQTWPDFTAATPTLAWDQFLAGAELPESAVAEVINCQRTFLGEVAPLVVVDRLEDWRAWARWQLVDALAPYLSSRPRRAELRLLRPDATGHSGAPGTLEAWRQPGRGGLGRGWDASTSPSISRHKPRRWPTNWWPTCWRPTGVPSPTWLG